MKLRKYLFYGSFGPFLIFLIHSIAITVDGFSEAKVKADLAVVLGNTVHTNGEVSARLKARLDRAVALFEAKQVQYIMVSGGLGKEGHNEAVVMNDYLLKKNIPSKQIIIDKAGNTTRQTALNTKRVLAQNNWDSVIVVSQFYHISRTKLALKQLGIKKVYGSYARFFEPRDSYSLCREFPAYYVYWYKYR